LKGALKAGEESGLAVSCNPEDFREKMFFQYVEKNV
jgi:hypothetical protein